MLLKGRIGSDFIDFIRGFPPYPLNPRSIRVLSDKLLADYNTAQFAVRLAKTFDTGCQHFVRYLSAVRALVDLTPRLE